MLSDLRTSRPRVAAVWHSDLKHLNKTRDNHVRAWGNNSELSLLVPHDAEISERVASAVSHLVRAPARFSTRPLLHLYWLVLVIRGTKPDFVLGLHGSEPYAYLAGKAVAAPVVQDVWDLPGASTERSTRALALQSYGRLIDFAMRKADLVLATALLYIPLTESGVVPDKMIEVPNGTTAEFAGRAWTPPQTLEPRVLYAGDLAPARGSDQLVGAVRLLAESGAQLRLVLAGNIYDEIVAAELKAIDCEFPDIEITIVGQVPAHEIADLLDTCTVGLCLLEDCDQYRWAYPVKLTEYYAAGRGVVVSDLPGPRAQAAWADQVESTHFVRTAAPEDLAASLLGAIAAASEHSAKPLPDHCLWDNILQATWTMILGKVGYGSREPR